MRRHFDAEKMHSVIRCFIVCCGIDQRADAKGTLSCARSIQIAFFVTVHALEVEAIAQYRLRAARRR